MVNKTVSADSIEISGRVNLILVDSCKLTVGEGLLVTGDNSLTIWGENPSGSGTLEATGKTNHAGIGGGNQQAGGNITINGGTVTATGGGYAAGIGSGLNASGGTVRIIGGRATAKGAQNALSADSLTLSWKAEADTIVFDSAVSAASAKVKDGQALKDGNGTVYTGAISDPSALRDKTLTRVAPNITIQPGVGGSVTADRSYAQAGDTVTLTLTADDGYTVPASGPVVTRADGSGAVTTTKVDGNTWTFTMPTAAVNVTARFPLAPVEVDYIDADGSTQTATAVPLDGNEAELPGGWYVARGADSLSYDHTITFTGDAHLILADGTSMTVDENQSFAICTENGAGLTIYGQEKQRGLLVAKSYDSTAINVEGGVTVNGGSILARSEPKTQTNTCAIYSAGGSVTINAGTVEAYCTAGDGIRSFSHDIVIHGGEVTAQGSYRGLCVGNNLTIDGGTVSVTGENGLDAASGKVTIGGGKNITVGGDVSGATKNGCGIDSKGGIEGGSIGQKAEGGLAVSGQALARAKADLTVAGDVTGKNPGGAGLVSGSGKVSMGDKALRWEITAKDGEPAVQAKVGIEYNSGYDITRPDGGVVDKIGDAYAILMPDGTTVASDVVIEKAYTVTVNMAEATRGTFVPSRTAVGVSELDGGKTVTVTLTPESKDQKYLPDVPTASYVDGSGDTQPLALTAKEDGSYTFAMPMGNVTVEAAFITPWEKLQRLIDSAEDGDTVRLWDDVIATNEDTSPIIVSSGTVVTLDLDGHRLDRNLKTPAAGGRVINVLGKCKSSDYTLKASVKRSASRVYRFTGLKKATSYKAYVKAWRKVKGVKTYIGKASPMVHAIAGGYTNRVANPKAVTLSAYKVKLAVGKGKVVRASVTGVKSGRQVLAHVNLARYYSSDRNVATVSATGRIRARGAGSCTIYILANNGVRATVRVTVTDGPA